MTTTNITTPYRRELIVEQDGGTYLEVKSDDFEGKKNIKTFLPEEQVAQLVTALLGENATVITDLPEAKVEVDGWVHSGSHGGWLTTSPEKVLKNVKELLAVHAYLVKHKAEQEEAKKAEAEAVKAKRRDALATEFVGMPTTYASRSHVFRQSIDRIIELEEAAKVS